VLSPRSSGPSACRRTPSRKGQTSFARPFEHHGSAAQFGVAAQAVEGLVSLPTVAKPHKGSAPSTGPTGKLAAFGAMAAGPVPATVAAGASLTLVPEAPDQFGVPNLRVGMYTRGGDHETTPFVVLTSGCGRTAGVFSLPIAVVYHICIIFATV
jgi:hypothetical protein